jgi:hypothetical protein
MTLSASGTVIGEVLSNDGASGSGSALQALPVTGGAPLWSLAQPPSALQPLLLSPDGTLAAVSNEPPQTGGGVSTATSIYLNGTLSTSLSGWAVGWIDNGRLLVNNYNSNTESNGTYLGAAIYSPSGTLLASPSIPELQSFQVVTPQSTAPDLLYSPTLNSIVSLTSGTTTWTSASPPGGGNNSYQGAVAGSQIVFRSGNLVLAEPY